MIFVHCFGCRIPVTPSGRRPLITEPPTGNRASIKALHDMALAAHRRGPTTTRDMAAHVGFIHAALGLDVPLLPVRK